MSPGSIELIFDSLELSFENIIGQIYVFFGFSTIRALQIYLTYVDVLHRAPLTDIFQSPSKLWWPETAAVVSGGFAVCT